ncbi:hypothetical protein GCM10010335_36540 [Streptomyces galbus]|nr:hypothetical protein GCM10010335_36540 [Streptomyces galbus]
MDVIALVRKGSRWVVVDGTAYRWRLRGRSTYFQGLAWSPCTFTVKHADTPGMTLVITTDQPHLSNWIGREAETVRPPALLRLFGSPCAWGGLRRLRDPRSTSTGPPASRPPTEESPGIAGAWT